MHAPLTFETGAASHTGIVRKRNEDGYLVQPDIGVWAVADGMGGHDSGHIASATVIRSLQSIGYAASAPDLLARFEDRVFRANTRLKEMARDKGGVTIGATIAALLAFDSYYACIWCGDARVYLARAGAISQLSRDHTAAQELVEKGILSPDEARRWPGRNVVTRAIGAHDDAELEIEHGVLQAGDAFVICSDGLTTHVEDGEILQHVAGRIPQEACDALVALTLQRGGTDNVTVLVARCRSVGPRPKPGAPARSIWSDPA
jgi:serine/threonine protein phosphatase PrpC